MTKRKLRKNADISHPQSPHDGIHTCSKGCTKCSRGLRDTIEEQNQQIEALKRDVLEKTAELRKSEEHNEALCERLQDLNSELHTCSCANANMHKYKNENASLKAEVERLTAFTTRTIIPNEELQAQVERLTSNNARLKEAIDDSYKAVDEMEKRMREWDEEILNIEIAKNAKLRDEIKQLKEAWVDKKMQEDRDELLQQVERLTKAGDAMASSIQFNEEMAQDYNGPAIVHQSVQRWQAAKEGKTK